MKTATENKNSENRVLVLMPTGRDASLVCSTLEQANITASVCADANDVEENIDTDTGAVLIAEEALQNGTLDKLVKCLQQQPVWSDIPVVLFAGSARNSAKLLEAVGTRFNATIVERPIRKAMFISAIRGALRARKKQYETRDLLHKLEEADHQKDLFLATLSHELRTPLNSMLGWIQILRHKLHSDTDLDQALEVIERNARSQTKLVSDILFISRAITGKLKLKMEMVDLSEIILSAVNIIQPSIEAKNIKLYTSINSNGNIIKADAERLHQIFLNLLSNAQKFTPQNGRIEISTSIKNSHIEIEIRDTGRGIKPEFLPYVFERFRQADSSYTRNFGGLGLGLAIVHHLVKLHKGTVRVESEGINMGAVFTISLPLPAKQELQTFSHQTHSESSETSERTLKGIHILLVEDDTDSREMLKVIFTQNEIKTTAVETAAEALEAIREIRADILISDVGLPGEDGYELIRKIRKLAPGQGGLIPAIALTGYAGTQDRNLALRSGFQKHLAKPVDIDQLLELVRNLLRSDDQFNSSL